VKPVVEYATTVVVVAAGAATVLLVAAQTWQTIGPRAIGVSGRTLDSAPTALAVVAFAGVVAVIATKGRVRQLVGALVAAAGAAAIWRSAAALPAVSPSRAEQIMRAKQSVNVIGGAAPEVTTHSVWGVLSVVAAVLVFLAGVMVAVRGARWRGMSGRYRAPGSASDAPRPSDADTDRERARHDASLWGALERGDDPTA
jgi:uncharacterized membrane protein (TIGR02234 family)